MSETSAIIRGAVIGYGAAFNQGKHHASQMNQTKGIKLAAICDIDVSRTIAAKKDFEGIQTFTSIDRMLEQAEIDLVANVLPHNLHAPVSIQCSRAGKHVVIEKPMCITVKEATDMIIAAKESGKMISVYHNRRWDADFCTLKKIVQSGVIGDVFRIEMWGGGYGKPNTQWWRGRKTPSGGSFYDWGAHYLDWLLGIVPAKMINVTGFFYDRVWTDVSNEDHVEATIRFTNGAQATVVMSNITKVGRPRWTLWGEKGAIVAEGKGFKVYSELPGQPKEQVVEIDGSAWQNFYPSRYYDNIVAHITKGEELIIKAEEARRVIAIVKLAEKSSNTLQAEPVPYEFR